MKTTKKKWFIALQCLAVVAVVAAISVVSVLAARSATVTGGVSVSYVADKIIGSVSAQYQIGNAANTGTLTDIGIGTVSWDGSEATGLAKSLTTSNQSITSLTETNKYVTFVFSFNNTGDDDWSVSLTAYPNGAALNNFKLTPPATTTFTVNAGGSESFSLVYEIDNVDDDANFTGNFSWSIEAI